MNPPLSPSQTTLVASKKNYFRNEFAFEFAFANVSLMGWLAALKQFLINLNPSQNVTQKVKSVRCLFKIELWIIGYGWNFPLFNI